MNDMSYVEARNAYFADALYLVVGIIPFQAVLGSNMSENTIALPFSDIESFSVSGVNEPVNVGLELEHYLCRKEFIFWAVHSNLMHLVSAALRFWADLFIRLAPHSKPQGSDLSRKGNAATGQTKQGPL